MPHIKRINLVQTHALVQSFVNIKRKRNKSYVTFRNIAYTIVAGPTKGGAKCTRGTVNLIDTKKSGQVRTQLLESNTLFYSTQNSSFTYV